MTDLHEKRLAALTPKQREAVLLKEKGLKIKQIAEAMGITYNAARDHILHAERRFREYDHYQKMDEENKTMVEIPISRGECKVLMEALVALEREYEGHVVHRAGSDWIGRLPYESKVVADLYERLQKAVYGKVLRQMPPNWE